MNWQHFQAFLWLRWRLRVNQIKRAGAVNAVFAAMFAVALIPLTLMVFFGAIAVGFFVPPLIGAEHPELLPPIILFAWDALVLAFLFTWSIGTLTELQRSDALALDKFLHLPVSVAGAFVINYLTSLFSVNLLIFLPIMLGLAIGLVFSQGPAMLLLLPLLAAFLLATTALTYQFQGWLGSLMVNQRRRRTIIVFLTLGFILMAQIPNLINVIKPWQSHFTPQVSRAKELADVNAARASGKITQEEFQEATQRIAEQIKVDQENEKQSKQQTLETVVWSGKLANMILPPGWLALGAMDLAQGIVWPALLGIVGLGLIGWGSLWRSYRTTLRIYTGGFTAGQVRPAAVTAKVTPLPTRPSGVTFMERDLPWVPEQASAIALASFRSLVRAPESKMLLLSPLIMLIVFGSMILAQRGNPHEALRFLMVVGGMAMVLIGMIQFIGNQFGFDRAGFRVFVLTPALRRDIFLGKNLAVAPFALGMGFAIAVLIEIIYPMRVDWFLASLVEQVTMYLLFCALANWLSILAPMAIAPGTMKATKPGLVPLMIMFAFMSLYPLLVAPTLLPIGIAALVDWLEWAPGVPICLPLSLLICMGIVFLYKRILPLQGALLHAREQKILTVVTAKAE